MMEKHLRKSVHVDFTQETHALFRVACMRKGLSMQSVLEELAARVGRDDPYMEDVLRDLVQRKLDKTMSELSDDDIETVYNVIARESPLGGSS